MNRLPRKIKATVKRRPLRVALGPDRRFGDVYFCWKLFGSLGSPNATQIKTQKRTKKTGNHEGDGNKNFT